MNEEEKEMTEKIDEGGEVEDLMASNADEGGLEKKKKKKHKKKKKKKKDDDKKEKKSSLSDDKFLINGNYRIIKMLGFGAFGEIHLAYDLNLRSLRAIKFEMSTIKNPTLKHEYSVLEQLNKQDNTIITQNNTTMPEVSGIPKVYWFDRNENKYSYMVLDLLGPSLSDLFQLKEKSFSLETVILIGIQLLTRIEFVHERGFLHRDIKPENFVIGLNEKSNLIHIIDFGLSKRYKDKNSGQHIPYRENRSLVGTARYVSVNAHLGIEQSRRDDIEGIGYVLIFFYLGRLPWQSKQDNGKPQLNKIMEKKLATPPEILCKKLPMQFSYYFHYCKNLKFEDRPDYGFLKGLFAGLLSSRVDLKNEMSFDWFDEDNLYREKKAYELKYSATCKELGNSGDDVSTKIKKAKELKEIKEFKEESVEESKVKESNNKINGNNKNLIGNSGNIDVINESESKNAQSKENLISEEIREKEGADAAGEGVPPPQGKKEHLKSSISSASDDEKKEEKSPNDRKPGDGVTADEKITKSTDTYALLKDKNKN